MEEQRTFIGTHPWLKFNMDLRTAPPSLWMSLGEIRSKCEHIAGVPLDKETAAKLDVKAGVAYLWNGETTAGKGTFLYIRDINLRLNNDQLCKQFGAK